MTNQKPKSHHHLLWLKLFCIGLSIVGVLSGWIWLWFDKQEQKMTEDEPQQQYTNDASPSLREVSSQNINHQNMLREVSQYDVQPRIRTQSSR